MITQHEFFLHIVKDNEVHHPYGGFRVQVNCRNNPNEWRVLWFSPFEGKGFIPIRHPKHGWLMSESQAIAYARRLEDAIFFD